MSYFLLGGGVTEFIELTDTPAAYAGQALKGARVNTGETALEFATLSGQELLITPDYVFYNGAVPGAWTDLQLSTADGNITTQVLALIKIHADNAAQMGYCFRMNGETKEGNYDVGPAHGRTLLNRDVAYVLVPSDANGLLEWRGSLSASPNTTLTLMAYWEGLNFPEQELHTGALANVWHTLDLGTGPCFAYFRYTNNTGSARALIMRRSGHTEGYVATPDSGKCSGLGQMYGAANSIGYGCIPTDANGKIDWGTSVLGMICDFDIICYIKSWVPKQLTVFDGTPPLANTFYDLDLPLGRSIAVVHNVYDVTYPAKNKYIKEHGEGDDSYLFGISGVQSYTGYAMMRVGSAGIVERAVEIATRQKITLEGSFAL